MTDPVQTPSATAAAPPPAEPLPVKADFLKLAVAKIKANLELLLGRPVAIESAEPMAMSAADLVAKLPAPGLVLGLQTSGAIDSRLHCVVAQPLVVAMTCITQLKSETATAERLAGDPSLTADEQKGGREVASFILAALGDFAKETTGGRIVLAPAEPRFVGAGEAPSLGGDEPSVVIESWLTVSPAPASSLLLIVPRTLADAWSAPEPQAPSMFGVKVENGAPQSGSGSKMSESPLASAETAPALWVSARETFGKLLQDSVGDSFAMRGFATMPEVLAALESGPPPGIVLIEVPAGSEPDLEAIAGLRRHPALRKSRLIVALEHATRPNVLRCGALGILDVVPVDLDQNALLRRLTQPPRQLAARKVR